MRRPGRPNRPAFVFHGTANFDGKATHQGNCAHGHLGLRPANLYLRDENGEILGQSTDYPKAVALAVKDAKMLRQIGVRASVYSKRPNGKLRQEWTDKGDA
jgi:hypothetical protein